MSKILSFIKTHAIVLVVALMAVFLIDNARADDESLWLTTGEWSQHDNQSKHQYRQNNTGIGIQYDVNKDASFVAGWYNNSIHRESVYMGWSYAPLHFGGTKFGVVGALATGYCRYLPATPIGGLYGSYEHDRVGMNILWLPSVVVAIQLKVKLSK